MPELLDRIGIGGPHRTCVRNVARLADGLNPRPKTAGPHGYTGRPRACGGIGRRARLRALWTAGSVEVRVLSGALEKTRKSHVPELFRRAPREKRLPRVARLWQESASRLGRQSKGDRMARREYPGV